MEVAGSNPTVHCAIKVLFTILISELKTASPLVLSEKGKIFQLTVGGLEIEPLKSINISGPRSNSALIFSVAPCVLHLNLLKIAA